MENYWGEKWVDFNIENLSDRVKYKISNYGRVKSFITNKEDGKELKPCKVGGYPAIRVRLNTDKFVTMYMHRLVALHFIKPASDKHTYVIHHDHDKANNREDNLAWATKSEMMQHQLKSPKRIASGKGARRNVKLTESQVMLIKKKLRDPNRKTRIKMLARQFGVSEMQLYRIKSGENWGNIEPD